MSPLLYYITDGMALGRGLPEKIGAALAAGVDYVQVREKHLSARELFALVKQVANSRVLVNDRLDVALSAGVAGVHLPAGSPPPSALRHLTPQGFKIGVSCHAVDEVERAAAEGADFVVLGPIFASPGKGAPLGLGPIEKAARVAIPVLALGGITEANAASCLRAGARGIAAIRLFQEATDLAALVARLRKLP